jgi:CheY-like chemotaxis protein
MSIITVFAGTYCNAELAIKEILNKTGYASLTDADIVAKAVRLSNLSENKLLKAFSSKTSVFNQFSHEKERALVHLKLAVSQILSEHKDSILLNGFTGLLIPQKVRHVLRICLIADMSSRISNATASGMSESESLKMLHKDDEDRISWTKMILDKDDPWETTTYDMVLPTDKMTSEEIANLAEEYLQKDLLQPSTDTEKAIQDFLLASMVETVLADEGHFVAAESDNGAITLTINKHVLRLKRLEEELQSITQRIPEVKSVSTKVGKKFHKADVYRKYDLETPSKLLIVDDERQFVKTLSERLLMREIGSVVAYDGQSALDLIKEEEPEVMILDLKMPGIDGIQVLKQVKETNPLIEVIILTGHGSEADEKTCMDLGAFAYLEKPVDVNVLSDTIRRANEKIRKAKNT